MKQRTEKQIQYGACFRFLIIIFLINGVLLCPQYMPASSHYSQISPLSYFADFDAKHITIHQHNDQLTLTACGLPTAVVQSADAPFRTKRKSSLQKFSQRIRNKTNVLIINPGKNNAIDEQVVNAKQINHHCLELTVRHLNTQNGKQNTRVLIRDFKRQPQRQENTLEIISSEIKRSGEKLNNPTLQFKRRFGQ